MEIKEMVGTDFVMGSNAKILNLQNDGYSVASNQVTNFPITEQKLSNICKLSELGLNTAFFFHELRNIASRMNAACYLTRKRVKQNKNESFTDFINEVEYCLSNLKQISNDVLYNQGSEKQYNLVEIKKSLDQSVGLLEKVFLVQNIKIVKEYGETGSKVRVNEALLSHVYLNLFNNAAQAMEKNKQEKVLKISQKATASGVKVTITNNGPNIPESDLSKIFEPFFTTKEQGKGTGLGLYFSRENMKKWGGSLSVKSKKGKGASFILFFPKV